LEITEVRVNLQHDKGALKAFVSITLDDEFVVRGVKVIARGDGLFVAMPNREKSDGTYQDIAHPINHETRKHLEDTVLAAYEAALAAERSRTESGILA
jgi:stage V sporulation protein G